VAAAVPAAANQPKPKPKRKQSDTATTATTATAVSSKGSKYTWTDAEAVLLTETYHEDPDVLALASKNGIKQTWVVAKLVDKLNPLLAKPATQDQVQTWGSKRGMAGHCTL
jgi:hypothetical protein